MAQTTDTLTQPSRLIKSRYKSVFFHVNRYMYTAPIVCFPIPIMLSTNILYYRPQGNVMFSEASVSLHIITSCPQGVGGGVQPMGDGGLPNPVVVTSSGGHGSGRYASYWNAFLFLLKKFRIFIIQCCKNELRQSKAWVKYIISLFKLCQETKRKFYCLTATCLSFFA